MSDDQDYTIHSLNARLCLTEAYIRDQLEYRKSREKIDHEIQIALRDIQTKISLTRGMVIGITSIGSILLFLLTISGSLVKITQGS